MAFSYIVPNNVELAAKTPALRIPEDYVHDPSYCDWNMLPVHKEQGGDVHVPVDAKGRQYFPVEAATGTPLPIVVERNGVAPNLHHSRTPKDKFARSRLGNQAVRFSRLQRVEVGAHARAHSRYSETTAYGSETEEYNAIILDCCGYVPPFGIKDSQDMAVVELSTEERRRLRKPGIISVHPDWEARATIGEVLINYGLSQDFGHKWQLYIDEFLSISPELIAKNKQARQRKMYLGIKLADRAIGYAVEPATANFLQAKNNHLLRKSTPARPWNVIKQMVKGLESYHIPIIEDHLSQRYLV